MAADRRRSPKKTAADFLAYLASEPGLDGDPTVISLVDAYARQIVEVYGSGNGIQAYNLRVRNLTGSPLKVAVRIGTVFYGNSPRGQDMIACTSKSLELKPLATASFENPPWVACFSPYREIPYGSHRLLPRRVARQKHGALFTFLNWVQLTALDNAQREIPAAS